MTKPFLCIPFALILFYSVTVSGQEKNQNPFSNGKPIGLVYSDFYTGIGEGTNPSAFEVTRAYLGYEFQMSEAFNAKIQLDIGSPNDASNFSLSRRFAYFKDAWLGYTNGKISANFGIIPTYQFKLQEKIWGHRYISKTVIDEHGMGSSADLGTSITYAPSKLAEFDVSLMNGEGYSSLQNDYSYKAGLGVTAYPWRGLIVRIYSDVIEKQVTQWMLVNFIGYKIDDKIAFGVEYDVKFNNQFIEDQTREAFSTYLSYDINKKFQLFARYDNITSNITEGSEDPWNLSKDGSAIIGGIEYRPITKVKLALNYQGWYPSANDATNENYIYLNLEFRVW